MSAGVTSKAWSAASLESALGMVQSQHDSFSSADVETIAMRRELEVTRSRGFSLVCV